MILAEALCLSTWENQVLLMLNVDIFYLERYLSNGIIPTISGNLPQLQESRMLRLAEADPYKPADIFIDDLTVSTTETAGGLKFFDLLLRIPQICSIKLWLERNVLINHKASSISMTAL